MNTVSSRAREAIAAALPKLYRVHVHRLHSRFCSTVGTKLNTRDQDPFRPVRKVFMREEGEMTVVGAELHPGNNRALPQVPPEAAKACPICRNNIHVRMQDVLILRQFLDHNHKLLSNEVTGVCDAQQEELEYHVWIAQCNNLLPRPDDFQMPYRFSERVSMQNVTMNILPDPIKDP